MTKKLFVITTAILIGLSTAYAINEFPQKPKNLPTTDKRFSKELVSELKYLGTQYCEAFKNISNPEYEYNNEIKLSLIVCDKQSRYIGFSNIAEDNEQIITNIYSLGEAARTLAELTSDEMIYDISENIDDLQLLQYRPQVRTIYGSEMPIQRLMIEYQLWAEAINNYYRNL